MKQESFFWEQGVSLGQEERPLEVIQEGVGLAPGWDRVGGMGKRRGASAVPGVLGVCGC